MEAEKLVKDYAAWRVPVHEWGSPTEFRAAGSLPDGVHAIRLESGLVLDLFLRGNPLTDSSHAHVLTFLAGAVTGRGSKAGPFFSGLGIAGGLDMPVVAVADPGVDVDAAVNLAWYTGRLQDGFQAELASVLGGLAERAGRPLLLVGGSGAGFASLALMEELAERASGLVWNAQTDALRYHPGPVRTYLSKVLGLASSVYTGPDWIQSVEARINGRIQTRLDGAAAVGASAGLLYLQNWSDWHRENHLEPWLEGAEWDRQDGPGHARVFSRDESHAVAVADFAEGHLPPDAELLSELIVLLQTGRQSQRSLAGDLADRFGAKATT
ncbi:hypothetical protein [Zhihengliuella sp.]|uniref:hypothetical protein n=1 Tax=Zhihengliuella sp. TaxID=1954483 RepID=UPI002810E4BB|nr:hypothetical protein [Zhihengliuella sp.]